MQKKLAGILGGMGPEATVDFMSKVLQRTPAAADQDHIRLLVDHNPQVPNRSAAISGEGAEVGKQLADMARGLELAGADFLAMTCNTAHAFQGDIQAAVTIPFVSIIDEVIGVLKKQYPDKAKVGVLATDGCLQAQLYQSALCAAGYQPVLCNVTQLAQLMTIIYRIKAGDIGAVVSQSCTGVADELVQAGAEILLVGCTEIPLVLDPASLSVPMIDSTDVLAASVIDYALGTRALAE